MAYPHPDTPAPPANAAPQRDGEDPRRRIARRMREVQFDLVEACARVIDQVGRPDPARALAIADQRRQFANMLHASKFCHRRACRRIRSCQGEPTRCLSVLLPALGLSRAAQALLQVKGRRRRPAAQRPSR